MGLLKTMHLRLQQLEELGTRLTKLENLILNPSYFLETINFGQTLFRLQDSALAVPIGRRGKTIEGWRNGSKLASIEDRMKVLAYLGDLIFAETKKQYVTVDVYKIFKDYEKLLEDLRQEALHDVQEMIATNSPKNEKM